MKLKREQNGKKAGMPTDIIDGKPKMVTQNENPVDLTEKKIGKNNYSKKHKKRKSLKISFCACFRFLLKRTSYRGQKTIFKKSRVDRMRGMVTVLLTRQKLYMHRSTTIDGEMVMNNAS